MKNAARKSSYVTAGFTTVVLLALGGCDDLDPMNPMVGNSIAVSAATIAHAVPFHAAYTITPQLLFPGDPGYPARCGTGPTDAAGPAAGEGYATHLGRVTEIESACIDLATLTLTQGEFTFTAANGDLLWGEFEGSATFDPPPPNANLSCTWSITGGTGRFAGAAGEGVCVNSHQLGNGQSFIQFEGSIEYDASNARNR